MVQHRDAAPDSGQSTPDIRGLAAFDSLTVKNSRRSYSSFPLHPCLTCRILQGTWSGLGEGLSNGFVYALQLALRSIWTENDFLPPPSNINTLQASEVLFAAGDFRVAGYDTSTLKR
jgi:hypothetical protein